MGAGKSKFYLALEGLAQKKDDVAMQDSEYWSSLIPVAALTEEAVQVDIMNFCRGVEGTQSMLSTFKENNLKNLHSFVRQLVLRLSAASKVVLSSNTDRIQLHNVIILLTYLIPFLYEDDNLEESLWKGPTPVGVVINFKRFTSTKEEVSGSGNVPLIQTLLSALLDLSFCPHFTIPPTKDKDATAHTIDAAQYIWSKGIQCPKTLSSTSVMYKHRASVTRLLLVSLSTTLYTQPGNLYARKNERMRFLTGGYHAKSFPLYLSMLNTFLGYDPVGYGMPYGHKLVPDMESELLAQVCGQLVSLFTDFWPEDKQFAPELSEQPRPPLEPWKAGVNKMSNWICNLQGEEDLEYIAMNIARLLESELAATWLPDSQKHVNLHSELIIFLWRVTESNSIFREYLLRSKYLLAIIGPLLHHLHEERLEASSTGLERIGIYLLLLLSTERNFAVRLNNNFEPSFRLGVPGFHGSYGDLLLQIVHVVLTSPNKGLMDLYSHAITIIVNVSPYLKAISLVAANKLVHLFEIFSSPRFLFASSSNHFLVFHLLEAFNNMIQYQFEGNQQLVYVMIRRRAVFKKLVMISAPNLEDAAPLDIVYDPSATTDTKSASKPSSGQAKIKSSLGPLEGHEHFSTTHTKTSFIPTQQWLESWRSKLPLLPIQIMLDVLVPNVEKLCADKSKTVSETEILEFLKKGTLVGLLPVPDPIRIRKYQWVPSSSKWFMLYFWSLVFLKHIEPPVFGLSAVKLFHYERVQY
eukprot:m.40020 g.40020  ORF g.40020 m.40020 type:complete len:749 (+) comp9618_c0_seq1:158-2404(+)